MPAALSTPEPKLSLYPITEADPRKRGVALADLHALGIRPDGDDLAFNLVAHGMRQLDAAERQLVAARRL